MGGAEPFIKLKKKFLLDDPENTEDVIDVDRENGYGTKQISEVREGLSTYNPENGPLFEWCYGQRTTILLTQSSGVKVKLWISCLRQGDPNAGYFYQSADRKTLETLQTRLGPSSVVTSYFDDVSLFNAKKPPEENSSDSTPETPMEIILNTLSNVNIQKTKQITQDDAQQDDYETLGGFIGTTNPRRNHLK